MTEPTNDTQTADVILDAAEELFASQGFKATTIKQIGSAAGVNPALIYYYFENKETLYRELLRRLFGRIMAEGTERLANAGPTDAVRAIVATQQAVIQSRPTFVKLLVRELMEHGASHAEEGIAHLSATVYKRLCELIEAGQAAGAFRKELDARFTAISIISLIPYFHIARPVVGIFLGHGTEGPTRAEAEAYARHAAEFALAALLAHPPAGGEPEAPS